MKRLGLLDRAWIAIQDESVGRVRIVQPVVDEFIGQVGRHQVTGIQVAFGFHAELGALFDVAPEEFAGGDLRIPSFSASFTACVPLPAPGGPSNKTLT